MPERPTLETARLILRPFTLEDAPEVQRLAGAREVASTTANIPYPYENGLAEAWINTHQERFEAGALVNFAITRRDDGALLGAIGLVIDKANARAELGYWLGLPYWNQGYMTEAAAAVLRYAFEALSLNKVNASYLLRNPASGRVMQKVGMTYEGTFRQHMFKWGVFEDLAYYAILKSEYEARCATTS
jgi:RimJ/RimL family protein N-acetyltransferase